MRMRAFIMLGAALALASVSVVLARAWIDKAARGGRMAPPAAQIAVTRIVVAAEPLPYGGKLVRPKLRLADWPGNAVPHGAFTSIDDVIGPQGAGAEDRLVLRTTARDEPILKSKISGFGARASLSALIAPGRRAAAIRVNDINGVAGFVLPGDRVDVLLTRETSGAGRRDLATDVLLQSMKVLGIDQDANAEREKPAVVRAVTLEVTQEEAQKLTLAQRLGTLSLALRNAAAADTPLPRTITARDLPLAPTDRIARTADPPAPAVPRPEEKIKPAPHPAPAAAPVRAPLSSVRIVRGLTASDYDVAVEDRLPRIETSSARLKSPPRLSATGHRPPTPRRRAQPPAVPLDIATQGRAGFELERLPAAIVPMGPQDTDAGPAQPKPGDRG